MLLAAWCSGRQNARKASPTGCQPLGRFTPALGGFLYAKDKKSEGGKIANTSEPPLGAQNFM